MHKTLCLLSLMVTIALGSNLVRAAEPAAAAAPAADDKVSLKVTCLRDDHLFFDTEKPHFDIAISNPTAKATQLALYVEVSDLFGGHHSDVLEWVDLPAGANVKRQWTLEPAKLPEGLRPLGLFHVAIHLKDRGEIDHARYRTRIGITTATPAPADRSDAIAIGAAGVRGPAQLKFVFTVLERLGVTWIRQDEFSRTVIEELGPNQWQFGPADDLVNEAEKRGIKVLAHIGYSPKWATDGANIAGVPSSLDDFGKYVYKTVERYKDRVHHWEVWNEPDIDFFGGPVEQYFEVLKVAHANVKKADPEALVLMGGIQGVKPQWTRRLMELGGKDYFDIANSHAYFGPRWGPVKENWTIITDDFKHNVPFWITEMGKGSDNDDYLIQFTLQAYAIGLQLGARPIFWYDLRDPRGLTSEYNLYTLDSQREPAPKTSLLALATLIRQLPPGEFELSNVNTGDSEARVFATPLKTVIMTWSVRANSDTFTLPTAPGRPIGKVSMVDCMGNPLAIKIEGDKVTVPLTRHPAFITITHD